MLIGSNTFIPGFEDTLRLNGRARITDDQALLAAVYLHAHRAVGGDSQWRDVALRTLDAMMNRFWLGNGFASSLDADAGGHEGRHVTWTVDEVRETLVTADLEHLVVPIIQRYSFDRSRVFEGRLIPTLRDGEPFTPPTELMPAIDANISALRWPRLPAPRLSR